MTNHCSMSKCYVKRPSSFNTKSPGSIKAPFTHALASWRVHGWTPSTQISYPEIILPPASSNLWIDMMCEQCHRHHDSGVRADDAARCIAVRLGAQKSHTFRSLYFTSHTKKVLTNNLHTEKLVLLWIPLFCMSSCLIYLYNCDHCGRRSLSKNKCATHSVWSTALT